MTEGGEQIRRKGVIELVVLMILVLVLLWMFLPYEHSTDWLPALKAKSADPLLVAVEEAKRVEAMIHARRMLGRKGKATIDLAVKIDPVESMPEIKNGPYSGTKAIAHTTMGWTGMCIIHLSPGAVEQLNVIAHEVCHCVQDQDVIGRFGYVGGTSVREIREREQLADICEQDLMEQERELLR